jgi:uncharacterized protein
MSKPVKTIRYDLVGMTNTVKAGCYKVDVYEISDQGLYMARPALNHPQIAYIKSFLIPGLGLQVSRWRFHEATESNPYSFYDYYIDIGRVKMNAKEWLLRDFYLDVLVVEGRAAHILDTDEYLEAVSEKLMTTEEAKFALETTHALVNGLAENDYSLETWLKQKGIEIDLDKLK